MEEQGRSPLQDLQRNISDIQTELRKEMKACRIAHENNNIKVYRQQYGEVRYWDIQATSFI